MLQRFGLQLVRLPHHVPGDTPFCKIKLRNAEIVDLEALASLASSIPGMISHGSGQLLYALCYLQSVPGDVVEVGSWQGRSTSYLARAVQNSRNGRFFAVDHFKGNQGKEGQYAVNKGDLSDLEGNFRDNMKRLGLDGSVNLLNMPNVEAEQHLRGSTIRFLFIDGDHTRDGVQKDISLFFCKLVPGSIVVFDDFSPGFPGLVEAVDELLGRHRFTRLMTYRDTLVAIL